MRDFQRAQTNMFDVVKKICSIHYVTLSGYLPFVPVYERFVNLRKELADWLMKQAVNPKGIAADKLWRRAEAEADAWQLTTSLGSCARVHKLPELEQRSKIRPSGLRMASEKELTGICYQLHSDATTHIGLLAPYLIDAAWLTAFKAKIDAFVDFIGAPAFARSEIRKATAEVNRLVKEIALLLRSELDPLLERFVYTAPVVYSDYRNSRKLISPATEKPALKGKVTDTEGKPLKGLQVTIAKTARKSITTALGNFHFKRLADGKYTLIVKEKKKEVARQVVEVPVNGEVGIVVGSGQ